MEWGIINRNNRGSYSSSSSLLNYFTISIQSYCRYRRKFYIGSFICNPVITLINIIEVCIIANNISGYLNNSFKFYFLHHLFQIILRKSGISKSFDVEISINYTIVNVGIIRKNFSRYFKVTA